MQRAVSQRAAPEDTYNPLKNRETMGRTVLAVATALLVLTAGCLGSPGGESSAAPPETTADWTLPSTTEPVREREPSTPTPPSECPNYAAPPNYPTPPSNLSESAAKNVALASERAHVYRTLCGMGYDSFGVGGGVSYPEATVLNETDDEITIQVRMPYTTTERRTVERTPPGTRTATPIEIHADAIGYAVYRITTDRIERLHSGRRR